MIFVDSSVWIDFFNGRDTPQTNFLYRHLDVEPIVVGDLVLVEVLHGFRHDQDLARALQFLSGFVQCVLGGRELALLAVDHYRALRARGITVRKTIDALIATRCIVEGWRLLASDRDFDPFSAHLGLRMVPAEG